MLAGDGAGWHAVPGVARSRAEILAAAGSRYTYSANTLAYGGAVAGGAERLALVGMGCQASAPVVMRSRKAGKVGRRLALSIGPHVLQDLRRLHFRGVLRGAVRPGPSRHRQDQHQGSASRFWCRDGSYHEVPLKEGHAWTRQGCKSCPDFAAEHADISTGGIGALADWTLTVVRSELGQEVLDEMVAGGALRSAPRERTAPAPSPSWAGCPVVSRRRWPVSAAAGPRLGVPPPKGPPRAPATRVMRAGPPTC